MKRVILTLAFAVTLFLLASALAPPSKADIFDDNGNRLASGPYILFPVNTTYNSRVITLNLSFSTKLFFNVPLSATYSLDETPNINVPLVSSPSMIWNKNRVEGSVTLPELSNGSHTLSVYVEAQWGNGSSYGDSETVYFTVETTPPSSPSPPPSSTSSNTPTLQPTIKTGAEPPNADSYYTTIFATVILIVVLAGVVGLLVYHKKHRR